MPGLQDAFHHHESPADGGLRQQWQGLPDPSRFPAPHARALACSRALRRAAAQLGKVETVEQALFQNQEKWEQSGDVDGTVAAVLSAAEMTKVRALVKGGTL